MKKWITGTMLLIMLLAVLTGCSGGNKHYSKTEKLYIDLAVAKVEERYSVKIDKKQYQFSVGEQTSETTFVDLEDQKTPKVVSVSALNLNQPNKGEVISFNVSYNVEKKEVVSMNCEIQ